MPQTKISNWLEPASKVPHQAFERASTDKGVTLQVSSGTSMEDPAGPHGRQSQNDTPVRFVKAAPGGATGWVQSFQKNESSLKAVNNNCTPALVSSQSGLEGASHRVDQTFDSNTG